jgi:hypothetical protein
MLIHDGFFFMRGIAKEAVAVRMDQVNVFRHVHSGI